MGTALSGRGNSETGEAEKRKQTVEGLEEKSEFQPK